MIDEYSPVADQAPAIDHLSFSRINTFDFCPEKYRLQYVQKARGLVGLPLLLGSNWHVGASHGIKQMIESKTPKTKEVVEVAVEALKSEMKKEQRLDLESDFDNDKKVASDDLKKMMSEGFEQIKATVNPIESEGDFSFTLDDGLKVTGRKDCIEKLPMGGEILTEFKTTKQSPQKLVLFDPQMMIYQNSKPTIKALKKFIVYRHKNKNRDITIYQFTKNAFPKEVIQEQLSDIQKIGSQIKTASVSGYRKTSDLRKCSWCQYRWGCRPELFSPERENSVDDVHERVLFTTNEKKQGEKNNEDDGKTGSSFNTGDRKRQRNRGSFGSGFDNSRAGAKLPSGF